MNNRGGINLIGILLIIITIAGIILLLKITGILAPKENTTNINISNYISSVSNTGGIALDDSKNTYYKSNSTYDTIRGWADSLLIWLKVLAGFLIFMAIICIFIDIGIFMLYRKLQIPLWAILMLILSPIILNFATSFLGVLALILEIVLITVGRYFYFKAVGMSGNWAFLILLIAISSVTIQILVLVFAVVYIIAYIISNIRIAQIFNRGLGFTVGLVFLPHVFQAILGYIKEDGLAVNGAVHNTYRRR